MSLRLVAILCLVACPAAAWEAGTDGVVCTLTHRQDAIEVRLTFDPSVPLYTITWQGPDPWPVAPVFGIRFDGPQPNSIRTDRHVVSIDRLSVTVSDRGFGNVLDGLQFNETATAFSGTTTVSVSLEGAAEPVDAFRSCGQIPSA